MIDVLTSLELVRSEDIALHEAHEAARLGQTCQAIREEGVLRHPPLGYRMRDGRVLILDGAHRTCALQNMGCRWFPVQIVEEPEFRLETWQHLVPAGTWLADLQRDPALRLSTAAPQGEPVAELLNHDGQRFYADHVEAENGFQQRLAAWHRIVGSYSRKCSVNRIAPNTPFLLDDGQILLRFPDVSLQELVEAVLAGELMPAGVTRFTVRGRLLNLRIPLSVLQLDEEEACSEWEALRLRWSNALRLYSEAVYLCEV